MKNLSKRIAAAASAAAVLASGMMSASVSAAQYLMGDVNLDAYISATDAVYLQRMILGMEETTKLRELLGNVNGDDSVNIADVVAIRRYIINHNYSDIIGTIVDDGESVESTTTSTANLLTTTSTTTTTSAPIQTTTAGEHISAPIEAIDANMPSQGDAGLVVFCIEFSDATFSSDFTEADVDTLAFGDEDTSSSLYPFESMSAFYKRSSKGAMNLQGKAFKYTAKNPSTYYENQRETLLQECYDYYEDMFDFSICDGDGNGAIDATLICVPTSATSDNWWPMAGGSGDKSFTVDGLTIGHIITGGGGGGTANPTNPSDFVSSYLHEMGHCMGLPDYYLYYSNDYESMHGDAGSELMDVDATSDFGAFSKLMLGWYYDNQISVFNKAQGSVTYNLSNAQSADGNCVIIPKDDNLDSNYLSEYFVLEYCTDTQNNSACWQAVGNGIRIYHVIAETEHNGFWGSFKYGNGAEATNYDDDGIRLIRLVNDGGGVYKTGGVINSSTSGFGWYDSNENETIDPEVTITIGDIIDGQYTVTVSAN